MSRLTESELTENLDYRGRLVEATQNSGCYALEVTTPDDADEIRKRWTDHWDAEPENSEPERLAQATNVAYVGAAHSSIYSRLCDHVAGDVRKAGFLSLFPPERVASIHPDADPETDEYRCAKELACYGWTTYHDGVLLG